MGACVFFTLIREWSNFEPQLPEQVLLLLAGWRLLVYNAGFGLDAKHVLCSLYIEQQPKGRLARLTGCDRYRVG